MPRRKPDNQTVRLRAILDGREDRLPCVGVETLRRFHDYLVGHLAFPSRASSFVLVCSSEKCQKREAIHRFRCCRSAKVCFWPIATAGALPLHVGSEG